MKLVRENTPTRLCFNLNSTFCQMNPLLHVSSRLLQHQPPPTPPYFLSSYIFSQLLPPSTAILSYAPSLVVCSVCHTAAKSSFHAIKQPQRLLQRQRQLSVGESEGNHSIKPDGECQGEGKKNNKTKQKKQPGPKQLEGKSNQAAVKT